MSETYNPAQQKVIDMLGKAEHVDVLLLGGVIGLSHGGSSRRNLRSGVRQ